MQTHAPKFGLWLAAVIIGAIGILAKFIVIPVLGVYSFWLVAIGFAVLAVATVIKGL